jgi:hypothetical protein
MRVLSAAATDAAITVAVKENTPGRLYLVSVTLPAGYRTPTLEPVEIAVTTDVKETPTVRVPLTIRETPRRVDDSWMAGARSMVGRPAPVLLALPPAHIVSCPETT